MGSLSTDDPLPPEDWIGRAATGAGVDALYRVQSPRLIRFFSRRVAADEVLDLVHETFRRLLGVIRDPGSGIACPEAYLHRTAENLIRDRARRARFRGAERHEPFDEDMVEGIDPDGQLEARDEIARVDAAPPELDQHTRDIFLLHRIGGHSYSEIASARGMSVKRVEKEIVKALLQLRRRLRPDE